jgi:hypothetical protein
MKTLSTATQTAVAGTVTTPAYFVQLGFSTPLYLSTRGDQVWNGQNWYGGRLGKVSGLVWDGKGQQKGNVELINSDLAYSALILNEGQANKAVSIWMYYGDSPAAGDPVLVFQGVADQATIAPDKVTLTLIGENTRTMYSPRRFINTSMGFNHLRGAGSILNWGGQTYKLNRG